MPTVKQLRYLVAIADTLHFRRAAEMTHVTQPTLSGQLRELESRLGVQLVERSRARVVLTPIGKEIATLARTVLRDVQRITEVAKHGQQPLGGTIRLGVLPTLGPYLFPHILPELHENYPDLKLYVREGMPTALMYGLEEGQLDLLLFALPVRNGDLQTTRLFREPLWIAAPADHRLADKDFADRSDLKGETVLSLERGHRLHEQVSHLCEQYGAALSLDYEGTSLDTLRQMVAMGMGLSFFPSLYVHAEILEDDQVVARQMRSHPPNRMVGMIWRKNSPSQADYLTLASLIRRILKDRVTGVTVMG